MVEYNLAKVGVAGSNPVFRSTPFSPGAAHREVGSASCRGNILKLDVETTDTTKRCLKVEIAPEKVGEEFDRVLGALSRRVTMPGFRKGKVPPRMIESRFPETLQGEVLESLVPAAYRDALEEAKLVPVSDPQFEVGDQLPQRGKPFSFQATVEVLPEIEVEGYTGIPAGRHVRPVKEEDVDAAIDQKRRQKAEYLPVEGRGVEHGDWIIIDLESSMDGQPLQSFPGVFVNVGSEQLPQEIAEAVTGCLPGQEAEARIPRTAPDGTEKEVVYSIRVNEIKKERLLVVDDEFARDLEGFGSLAELRQALTKELEAGAAAAADEDVRRQILDELLKRNPVEVPGSLAERELEFLQKMAPMALQGERGGSASNELRELAERRVRTSLILDKIAATESIVVSDDELSEEMKRQKARRSGTNKEDVRIRLLSRKTVDFLVKNAKVKETQGRIIVTPEEASKSRREQGSTRRRRGRLIVP